MKIDKIVDSSDEHSSSLEVTIRFTHYDFPGVKKEQTKECAELWVKIKAAWELFHD